MDWMAQEGRNSLMNADQITDEVLEKGAEVPYINHTPDERYQMKNLDYGMTIGTAVTHKGRLFACWVGGGDNPKAFFLLKSLLALWC